MEAMPLEIREPKSAARGSSTRATAPTAATVTRALTLRRTMLMGASAKSAGSMIFAVELGIAQRRCTAGYCPHQELRQNVHDDGHNKECQTHLDQGAEIKVSRSFAEFVGDHAGHGVAGSEKRLCDLRTVANHHGDRHGFTQRPAQTKNHAAHDAGASIAQNPGADHLPPGGSQCEDGFA